MYLELLNGLFSSNNLTTEQAKKTFLQNLQPLVRGLRNSYQSFPVRFDYTNKSVQAAYLLTYFPHYTDFLFEALSKTEGTFANQSINELQLFGSGPCPEIIGYLRYAKKFSPTVRREIKVVIHDIAVADWKYSRDIIFNNVLPSFLNGSSCNRSAGQIDISQPFTKTFDAGKKLIVFQNCLNEIAVANHTTVISNFRNLFANLPSGSYLAIIDLDLYQMVNELVTSIENTLTNNFNCEILRSVTEGGIQLRSTFGYPPEIITENLLTDIPGQPNPTGLLPKRTTKFIYSLIRKT